MWGKREDQWCLTPVPSLARSRNGTSRAHRNAARSRDTLDARARASASRSLLASAAGPASNAGCRQGRDTPRFCPTELKANSPSVDRSHCAYPDSTSAADSSSTSASICSGAC